MSVNITISLPSFSKLKEIRAEWTWQEIRWGKESGIVTDAEVKEYALEQLKEEAKGFDTILNIVLETWDEVENDRRLETLCRLECKEDEDRIRLVWRRTIIKWFYLNIEDDCDLQKKVNGIYDDFGFPKDMRILIDYMPRSVTGYKGAWSLRKALAQYFAIED